MNIEVGGELHYVPDVLFEDGTYKDVEDYIKTTLTYRKLVTLHNPLNATEEEAEPPLTVDEVVQELNYLTTDEDDPFVRLFDAEYDGASNYLDIVLEIRETIYPATEHENKLTVEDVLDKAKKCLEKYLKRINAIKKIN